MRISDWSSDVCSSDLTGDTARQGNSVSQSYGVLTTSVNSQPRPLCRDLPNKIIGIARSWCPRSRLQCAIKGAHQVHLVGFRDLHERHDIDGSKVGLPSSGRTFLDPFGYADRKSTRLNSSH